MQIIERQSRVLMMNVKYQNKTKGIFINRYVYHRGNNVTPEFVVFHTQRNGNPNEEIRRNQNIIVELHNAHKRVSHYFVVLKSWFCYFFCRHKKLQKGFGDSKLAEASLL